MLIAAQAKRGMIAAATAHSGDASPAEAEARAAESTAASMEMNINELQANLNRQNLEIALREEERNKYQILVDVASQRLAEYRNQLSADERNRYDLEQELVKSKNE